MKPSLHHSDGRALKGTQHQSARMGLDRGDGESRDLFVGHHSLDLDEVGERTEACTEHNRHAWLK